MVLPAAGDSRPEAFSPVLKHGPNTACGGKDRERPWYVVPFSFFTPPLFYSGRSAGIAFLTLRSASMTR